MTRPLEIHKTVHLSAEGLQISAYGDLDKSVTLRLPQTTINIPERRNPETTHPRVLIDRWLLTQPPPQRAQLLDAIREAVRFIDPDRVADKRPHYPSLSSPDDSLESAQL